MAGFANAPLLETPASVSVLTSQQMLDLQIRSTTDAARYIFNILFVNGKKIGGEYTYVRKNSNSLLKSLMPILSPALTS